MPLDYNYTCQDLDKLIDEAKDVIFDHIQDIVLENNPLIEEKDIPWSVGDSIKECSDALYNDLEGLFEGCRTMNEDIRAAADKQIGELQEQIDDLTDEVNSYEQE